MVVEVGVAVDMSLPPLRNGDPHYGLINRLMVGTYQLDEDLVRARREAIENHGLSAGISPEPRGVVDRHMDVSHAGRHGKRGRPKHRHYVQVFSAILNPHPPPRHRWRYRRSQDQSARPVVLR